MAGGFVLESIVDDVGGEVGREGQSRQAKKDGIEISLREVPLGLGGFVYFQQNNKLNYGLQ